MVFRFLQCGRSRPLTVSPLTASAVQAVKRQASATIAEHVRAREALDQALGNQVRASADFQEGIAAFRSKRQPPLRKKTVCRARPDPDQGEHGKDADRSRVLGAYLTRLNVA